MAISGRYIRRRISPNTTPATTGAAATRQNGTRKWEEEKKNKCTNTLKRGDAPARRGQANVKRDDAKSQREETTSHISSSSSLSTAAALSSESAHASNTRRCGGNSRRRETISFLASGAAFATSSSVLTPRASLAFSNPEPLGDGTKRVYGEATTAASYGGYGGSDKSEDRFKYTYEVPEEWRAETINKIEKGVTGIDNRQSANKNTKVRAHICTPLRRNEAPTPSSLHLQIHTRKHTHTHTHVVSHHDVSYMRVLTCPFVYPSLSFLLMIGRKPPGICDHLPRLPEAQRRSRRYHLRPGDR